MTRKIGKLSALFVGRTTKPGYYGDGGGLYLQISKSGSKSWVFRFTRFGKTRDMGLGPVHTVSLAEARIKAGGCRSMLLNGRDPLEERNAEKTAQVLEQNKSVSFDDCAAQYIAAHRNGWKNAKHASQWENTLRTYASPIIGKLPVAAVDTAMVVKVLSQPVEEGVSLWNSKTETATRLRGRIESILDWATVSTYRKGENPARWKGHLENLLANPQKTKRVAHHPALAWQEIGEFMPRLRQQEGVAARALELAILTACRSGEVRLAAWDEIDLTAALWVIPGERMKAGKEHRIPLSTSALSLLESMPRLSRYVFPGVKMDKPLSDMSLTAVLRRMNADVTTHGFRSTFRDWCAESVANSFPREVCEHALAHSLPDKVEAAYRRGDLLEKRILLMQAWADYCDTPPSVTASVTPIRGIVVA